jgi:hypothetical protein
MREVQAKIFLGAILFAGAIAANAQVYGGGYYDRGRFYGEVGRDRDDRYRDDRGGGLFNRVRADLDRAEGNSHWNGGDRRRFNKVREELGEFQGKWVNGRFDKHELDDAIGALQKVVRDNRLDYRDRDVLAEDLSHLRDFRARYGYYR